MLDANNKGLGFIQLKPGDSIVLENGNLLKFYGDDRFLTFHDGDNKALITQITKLHQFHELADLIVTKIFGLKLDYKNSKVQKHGSVDEWIIPII